MDIAPWRGLGQKPHFYMENCYLRGLMFGVLMLLGLVLVWLTAAGQASAQSRDRNYDQRAQDVLTGLIRHNGLAGWAPNSPETWPETDLRPAAAKTARPAGGLQWDRSVRPARLVGLILPNQGLQRSADLSGLTALSLLDLSGNHLRDLDLTGNINLTDLAAVKNQFSALKLDGCPRLARLALSVNQLKSLDLSANAGLREVAVSMNQLSEIDLGHNPELTSFEAMNNRLSRISVAHNPALTRLGLSYNRITELDLAFNPRLSELGIRDNELTGLDLSHNPDLRELTVSRNQLTELDLSHNPGLTVLAADQNQLSRLDLSRAEGLIRLEAQRNPLTEIIVGQNQLADLVSLNLDGGRLPLSQLAPLAGKAQNRARFGEQEPVLFERRELAAGQALDLSTEAYLNGAATEFTVLTEKKRRVRPEDYTVSEGLIVFHKPGRYLVRMTNEAVFSSRKNETTGRIQAIKTKVHTGVIEVRPEPES